MKRSNSFARSRSGGASSCIFGHVGSENDPVVMFSSQAQVKELQRELEDSRAAQKEVLASAREAERRSRATEADVVQLQEVRPRGEAPPSLMKLSVLFAMFSPFLPLRPDVGSS